MNENEDLGLSKDWFIRLLKGAGVGIGGILPGLSGGVLAVIFGLYDKIIDFLGNITQNFWRNVRYFIPVVLGFGAGVVVFAAFVEKAFGTYEAIFTSLFIGFVIGTFPLIFKQAGEEGRNVSDLAIMGVTAIGLFFLMVLGGANLTQLEPSVGNWLFSGALIGLGVVVPGMSPSNFLIYFGLYEKMSAGISSFDFSVIIPLGIGFVVCILLLAKFVKWLFKKFYSKMYHFILGTVLGSSLAIFPTVVFPSFTAERLAEAGLSFGLNLTLSVVAVVAGAAFSLWFSRIEEKYSKD